MRTQNIDHLFNFSYEMPSSIIITKATQKVLSLKSKIEERKNRIKALRTEYKITDSVYIDLLEQAREASKKNNQVMTYSVSNMMSAKNDAKTNGMQDNDTLIIGAGVVNNLLTESDFIKSEEAQVTRLELICRNLNDLPDDNNVVRGHTLREEELVYLGF